MNDGIDPAVELTPEPVPGLHDQPGILGHPRGLPTLFFTEMWERFSYYGMRSLLIIYMTTLPAQGGLGFSVKEAASIYGTYIMAVYLTGLPGGLIADHILGTRVAVLVGGIIIALGHFSMVVSTTPFFYGGMIMIAAGTGLLKPNISALVGSLYREGDSRRDSGFSIFYMGINIGSFIAPLLCGFLAQDKWFTGMLAARGFNPALPWHLGFGAAGVGMTLGLVIYLLNQKSLRDAAIRNQGPTNTAVEKAPKVPLTPADWRRIGAIFVFFLFTILFWGAYEQKGASLNLFAKSLVRTEIFGWAYPSIWLQSLTPLFVIILAPIFSIIWLKLGDRQPTSPIKFTLGLLSIGMAFVLLVPASALTATGRISPLWLVGVYFLEVVGEMCLSPVGLSTVTKLAPLKLVGIMMGVWFLAASLGGKLAGRISEFFDAANSWTLIKMYGGIAIGLLISAGVLALIAPKVRRLMGTVR
jgi:POT family proton-dependent oligopeptide transporter